VRKFTISLALSALAVGGLAVSPAVAQAFSDHVPHGTLLASLSDSGGRAGDDFSIGAVSIDGNTAVVGASGNAGAAYIYVRGEDGWPTSPTVTLPVPPASNGGIFGNSVHVSGRVIVVGAYGSNSGVGAAYVYVRGRHGWPTAPTFALADPNAPSGEQFGSAVSNDGDTVIVGAWEAASGGGAPGAGAAYVYRLRGDRQPVLTASIADPTAMQFDNFGQAVALSGGTLLVGAPGVPAAYIFKRGSHGWPSAPTTTLADPAASPSPYDFGTALATSGRTILVGSGPLNTAYIYTKGSQGWPLSPTVTLTDPLGVGNDDFGASVAVDDQTALVGADNANSQGAVYTYIKRHGGWQTSPRSTFNDPGTGLDAFGEAVSVSDGTAIGGAWLTLGDTIVGGIGAAYIFTP
jgi:hypothetical protein